MRRLGAVVSLVMVLDLGVASLARAEGGAADGGGFTVAAQSVDIPSFNPVTGMLTTKSVTFNIWELGLEGGYDLDVADKLVVRPGLGLGLAGSSAGAGSSSTDLYIALGAGLLYDLSDSIFLGAEARFQHIFVTGGGDALILLANGGMRF